jgi:hypothetical protein
MGDNFWMQNIHGRVVHMIRSEPIVSAVRTKAISTLNSPNFIAATGMTTATAL